MELISEYFSWCEGGRKSSIDPGDKVSSSASKEKEEEAVVGKKKKWLIELGQIERMKDHCIRRRRRRRLGAAVKIRANGKE